MTVIEQAKPKPATFQLPAISRHDLHMVLTVTRREVKDSFRDWRIIIPIFLLTLFFPLIMNFTAVRLLNFVNQFNAELIGTRLIPFLLLVVGFFPTSFSLVIALETFVGEKERKSLEPLLATPLTNTQLYMGKVLAAIIPPLFAAYVGIAVYLVGLAITVQWYPTWELFIQTVLITTFQALVMVAGAVVISSQTTSVRASNLLASFIIVPMALLLQSEAGAMFIGNFTALWWIVLGMAVVAIILVRMGIFLFNREELLGRSIDHLHLLSVWRMFWQHYSGRDDAGKLPSPLTWYRQTFRILPKLRQAAMTLIFVMFLSVAFGYYLSNTYTIPPEMLEGRLASDVLLENLEGVIPMLSAYGAPLIVAHNLRVFALQTLVGVFTFGVLGILIFMTPWVALSYAFFQMSMAGESVGLIFAGAILPHAIFEVPVLLLMGAAALRWHILFIAPPPNRTVLESWTQAGAEFARIFVGLVLPLITLAAIVEAYITPQILLYLLG